VKIGTSGTFAANVPSGLAGGHILCATTKFQTTFGIIPDLIITGALPVLNGQVSYEQAACRVNSIGYGSVATPLTGTTLAPPLPAAGATILIRRIDSPITVTCPLTEDAGARFVQKQGTTASPDTFTNNSGQSVFISSTVAGVATPPSAMPVVRVFPNPFHGSTRIEAPDWQPLTIHDIRGRLVRVLTCRPGGACPQIAGPYQGDWNGTDSRGRAVASGIYYLQYTGRGGPIVKRIVLMR
jgi:hypothetical protein